MNFILKIVQGPNTGAELALVEGVNVKLGKGEECDVVLADQTLSEVACELEVSAERVMMLLPGGGQERLEPYRVKILGTTAIAMGPADSQWETLIWPGTEEEAEADEAKRKAEEEAAAAEAARLAAEEAARKPSIWGWKGRGFFLLVFLALELLIWFLRPAIGKGMDWGRDKIHQCYKKMTAKPGVAEVPEEPLPQRSLAEIAAEHNLVLVANENDKLLLSGNLKTRQERLQVTAEAFQNFHKVQMALSDDESMRQAAQEMLWMLSEGKLRVVQSENRKLALAGEIGTVEELRRVLEGLKQDVAFLEEVNVNDVTVRELVELAERKAAAEAAEKARLAAEAAEKAREAAEAAEKAREAAEKEKAEELAAAAREAAEQAEKAEKAAAEAQAARNVQTAGGSVPAETTQAMAELLNGIVNAVAPKARPEAVRPSLPVVGVMTVPYPCLVTQDGSRLFEGADFQGYVIEKITEEKVVLRKGEERLDWRP